MYSEIFRTHSLNHILAKRATRELIEISWNRKLSFYHVMATQGTYFIVSKKL